MKFKQNNKMNSLPCFVLVGIKKLKKRRVSFLKWYALFALLLLRLIFTDNAVVTKC